jgi:hypothetical protein
MQCGDEQCGWNIYHPSSVDNVPGKARNQFTIVGYGEEIVR